MEMPRGRLGPSPQGPRRAPKIGYGGAHVAEKQTRLATIAAGNAYGLPRNLSGRGAVYYN